MTTVDPKVTPALVDKLGRLRVQLDKLAKEEKAMREAFIQATKDTGVTVFEGKLFNVTVSKCTRKVLDMVAVRKKLSKQFLATHTSSSSYYKVLPQAKKRP